MFALRLLKFELRDIFALFDVVAVQPIAVLIAAKRHTPNIYFISFFPI